MQAKFSSILFVAVFVASSIDSVATESKAIPRLRRQDDMTARYLTTAPRTGTASNEERGPLDFFKNLFANSEKLNVEPNMNRIEATARATSGPTRIGGKDDFLGRNMLLIMGVAILLAIAAIGATFIFTKK